jgi:hypothetical protein
MPWIPFTRKVGAKRDPARIPEVLDLVRKACEKYPDLRLGQLIENCHLKGLRFLAHGTPVTGHHRQLNRAASASV